MSFTPCPRILVCTYKDKGEKCLSDKGGRCYEWFLNAGRVEDEKKERLRLMIEEATP